MRRRCVSVQRLVLGHGLRPLGFGWKLERVTATRRHFVRLIPKGRYDTDKRQPSSRLRAINRTSKAD